MTRIPAPIRETAQQMDEEEKIAFIADHFREIMNVLGLNLDDKSLSRTPYRVAKMYVKEIFSGLDEKNFPVISFIEDRYQTGDRANMVFSKVRFTSFCEHHFVPIIGTAYAAYLPNGKLIGLSKIPRIVRFFARRPQVQERLTAQIADTLAMLLETEDVAVSITAQHFCVTARGIEDETGYTTTNVMRGRFGVDEGRRQEFFETLSNK
jgi:GTP cyclohydrolase I